MVQEMGDTLFKVSTNLSKAYSSYPGCSGGLLRKAWQTQGSDSCTFSHLKAEGETL